MSVSIHPTQAQSGLWQEVRKLVCSPHKDAKDVHIHRRHAGAHSRTSDGRRSQSATTVQAAARGPAVTCAKTCAHRPTIDGRARPTPSDANGEAVCCDVSPHIRIGVCRRYRAAQQLAADVGARASPPHPLGHTSGRRRHHRLTPAFRLRSQRIGRWGSGTHPG